MNKKVDLIDFQRKFREEYGLELEDREMEKIRDAHILTFWDSDEGEDQIMSKLPSGGIVFRHKDGGMKIRSGETWFCDVIDNRPRQDCFCRTLAISRASSSWLERSAVFPPPDLWFRRDLREDRRAHSDCLYRCCKFCTGCL